MGETVDSARRFPATATLARFAAGFTASQATPELIARAKVLILDLLGCAIAAIDDEIAHALRPVLAGESGPATLIGHGSASAAQAAFANGALAHALEYDDATLNPVGHPSATILPAVLALAEQLSASGAEALAAYLVGLEVHSRLGQAQVSNWQFGGGWLPIGHIGVIGAAVACAHLLRLEEGRICHAIGLAAQFSGQLAVNSGTAAKPLGAGRSAQSGLVAAQLAMAGATAADGIIEMPGGFCDTFFGPHGHALETALAPLGAPHHLEQVGVAIKRYPSCYGCHWGVDALLHIMARHDLRAPQIGRIEHLHPASAAFLDHPRPATPEEARFSHQYNLAVTALDGMPVVASFTPQRMRQADVQDMLDRVVAGVHPADSPEARDYVVHVTTRDGRGFSHSVRRPLGHPRQPMDRGELANKFRRCTQPWLAADDIEQLIALVEEFERLPRLAALSAILRRAGAGRA